ncbi:MAG: hypothetical protein QOE90_3605 [Thermoplasmata archaeon]|jgi:hypothetical protein|nr:hypothetical protein [Thermoplasmata archaeon]
MRTPALIPTACLVTLLLLSGAAAALPLVDVQADAHASADASGAQKLAESTLADAQARVDATKASAEATAQDAHAKADATVEAGHGLAASFGHQMASFGAWIRGLFGAASEAKAEVHAEIPSLPAPPQPDLSAAAYAQAQAEGVLNAS